MSRRIAISILAAFLVLATAILAIPRWGPWAPDAAEVQSRVAGDVEDMVRELPAAELPAQARGLLATDRPWRAARVMDRYVETADAPGDDLRVLAARAHGGWGNWPEVLSLLEGMSALESYEDGVGLYLLGRARDETGDATAAAEAYRSFLAFSPPAGELEEERSAARLRLGLSLIRSGDRPAGQAELASLGVAESPWMRVLQADALATTGDTTAVRQLVTDFDSGLLGLRGWRARVEAARQAGDLAQARALANRARSWARTDDTRSELLLLAGEIALEMGDVAAARDAFRSVIDRNPGRGHSRRAAQLLQTGDMIPADHLAVARVQVAQGLHEQALDGFREWMEAGTGSSSERADVRMEYATALFYAEQYAATIRALEPLAGRTSARLLMARAEAHRDRMDAAVDIYLDIADERAGSGTGRNALFLAAGARHDNGELEEAVELYRAVVRQYPGSDRMGLSMMRLAGIAFDAGDYAEAARIWDQYRNRYTRGDRALQATYWAGRAREEAGDSTGASALFRTVRERDRDSYYALLASRRLGVDFWPLPLEESPAGSAAAERRVGAWMRELDLLRNAGFDEAASALADDLVRQVGGDRQARYALAEALADRGYSQRAIRIGITLQGSGAPNQRLLQILYPFPYRTLITEEARDRGIDPFVTAALIRQESMFERLITSPAGARGLMQIMPATGRQLAEAVGMEQWDAELLYQPEINVHLGTRYVAQHLDEYDGSLPSVFSAYNAGPHRVERWSEFGEYGNDELFTERIPYRETRDYVKILTRNRALYSGLYSGSGGPDGSDEVAGSQSVNVEPRPISLSTSMSPPRSRAIWRLMASPSPAPAAPVSAPPNRENSWKILSRSSAGMPGPVSLTSTAHQP